MAINFDKDFYLQQKLTQLQQAEGGAEFETRADVEAAFEASGLTAEQHYVQFGAAEDLNPNANFDTNVYLNQKLAQLQEAGEDFSSTADVLEAIQAAGLSPLSHYNQFGAFEGVSPNRDFNVPAYLADKLAQLQEQGVEGFDSVDDVLASFQAAGLSPLDHFEQYGRAEGLTAKPLDSASASDLTEALAIIAEGGELPEGYTLSDTALVLEAGTIAAIGEQIAAAQAVVDGAANAEELEFAPEFAIEDSGENVLAAAAEENPLVADISLITLTDETITAAQRDALVELGFDAEALPELAPLTLTEALVALQDAQADKADFLKEAAESDFVKAATGATTEAKIAAAVTDADGVVAAIQYDTDGDGTGDTNVYGATDSDGVKAAKVADAQAQLAENLTDAQEALADAQADVAKISGLASAIDLYNARVEAQEATAATLKTATADQAAAVANYDSLNSSATTVDPDGTVTGLIVKGSDGRLALDTGVTEAAKPGVTALLTAVQAQVDAAEANSSALEAIEAAVIAIGYLDFTSGDKDNIGAAFDPAVITVADSDKLTQAQIQVELNEQLAAAEELGELTFDADGLITDIDGVAIGTEPEVTSFNTLKGEVNTFETTLVAQASGEYTFATTVETKVQIAAQDDVATAEKAIVDLDKALSDLTAAKDVAAELKAFDDGITAAEDAFEDLGVEVPVTIDGTVIGTAENDVFLASDKAGTVVNFNAQGEDSIFFGTDFADLVTLGSTEAITSRVGDAAALEIFAKQNGSNVDLYVEQETFAGNGTTEADIVKITLSGVSAEDLVLAEGFLTIA